MKRISPLYTNFARKLRKESTDVEKIIWYNLRNKQIEGIKFRRQYTIDNYIVDFVSTEKKLVIEIDGGQHNEETNRTNDETRTRILQKKGYRILRFWNNDITENLESVLEEIRKAASYPHPNPLP